MAVYTGAYFALGVVEVEGIEPLKTDYAVECFKRFVASGGGGEVVAGGEDVAGVDADANRDFLMDPVDDVTEVFELPADTGTLPSGRFQ